MIRSIVLFLFVCLSVAAVGCAVHHIAPIKSPNPVFHPFKAGDDALKSTDKTLDLFISLALLAIALAFTLFFTLPGPHNLSVSLGIGGGSLLGLSLFLKVLLPFVPIIGFVLLLGALAALGYEIYEKVHTGKFVDLTAIGSEQSPPASATLAANAPASNGK
jgi:hypothetical protein